MTLARLAEIWIEENAPRQPIQQAHHQEAARLKRLIARRVVPKFVFRHDDKAYSLLLANEECPIVATRIGRAGKMRRPGPIHTYGQPLVGIEFVKANVAFSGTECLFMPFCDFRIPSGLTYNYQRWTAARLMCRLVHGWPNDGMDVARHLCGNGHMSCVNPKHLVWGSVADNAADARLHQSGLRQRPHLDEPVIESIRSDDDHPNVIAIKHQIPTMEVVMIKSGADQFIC